MRFSPLARRTALGLTLSALVVGVGAALPRRSPEELLGQVMTLVRDRYAASEVTDVYAVAARGLVRELGDPYSQLLSPKELEDFSRSTLGRYAGVGMEVVPVADSFYVGEVFPGGASAAAGFRRGDRLLRVDGRAVDGMALDSVVSRLRGTPNSTVEIETRRGEAAAPTMSTLHRGNVRLPAVPYVVVQRGIGYVPLPGVTGSAGPDMQAAIARAVSGGAKGLVIDLRGNGGGAVDQAVKAVSGLLPAQKPVLEIRERTGSLLLRTEPAAPVNLPVVVLQDGGTASAAEIMTGALQDHDRALIVGTRSFGKGLAQSVFPLDGGWALKLTTARWFTPAGRSIHRDRTAADSARHVALVGDAPAGATAGLESKTFKTMGGRALRGEGGISPDVVVPYDTLSGPDRAMAVALGRDGANAGRAIARLAHQLSLGVDSTFTVTPAWREQLRRELAQEHVTIDSTQWAAASTWVSQLLEQRVATFAFGPGEARRRALQYDRQYQVADSLLRSAANARDLVFRVGTTAASRGGA